MAILLKVLTVVSLVCGTVLLLPWMGVLIANIMAMAGMDAAPPAEPAKKAVVMLFIVSTTLWPLSLMASYGLSITAWVAQRPGLALALSLLWVVWGLACAVFFGLWASLE